MTEAWVKRSAERQELLQELMEKIEKAIEEAADSDEIIDEEERMELGLDFIQVIAAHLKQKVRPQDDRLDNIDLFGSSVFFQVEILPRVLAFSRAEEENEWLLLELMGKLKESIDFYLHNKLTKLEYSDPQQIFRAPSAMTEVSLNP